MNKLTYIFLILIISFQAQANWFSEPKIPKIQLGWWSAFVTINNCNWYVSGKIIECVLFTKVDIPAGGIFYKAMSDSGVIVRQGKLPEQSVGRNQKVVVSMIVTDSSIVELQTPSVY